MPHPNIQTHRSIWSCHRIQSSQSRPRQKPEPGHHSIKPSTSRASRASRAQSHWQKPRKVCSILLSLLYDVEDCGLCPVEVVLTNSCCSCSLRHCNNQRQKELVLEKSNSLKQQQNSPITFKFRNRLETEAEGQSRSKIRDTIEAVGASKDPREPVNHHLCRNVSVVYVGFSSLLWTWHYMVSGW